MERNTGRVPHLSPRPVLPFQSERLHILGQEAVVAQEEAAVAAGHAGGRAAGHRRGGGRGAARAAGGPAAVGRPPRAPVELVLLRSSRYIHAEAWLSPLFKQNECKYCT